LQSLRPCTHKSPWIHDADLRCSPQQHCGTRGWSPRLLAFAKSHRALSAPFLVRRSIPAAAPNRHNASSACPTRLGRCDGALLATRYLPTQFGLNLQVLGGLWILQTFPALVFGMFVEWFTAPAGAHRTSAGDCRMAISLRESRITTTPLFDCAQRSNRSQLYELALLLSPYGTGQD
jgi:hypothetical protein